jgi:hypothetical protein
MTHALSIDMFTFEWYHRHHSMVLCIGDGSRCLEYGQERKIGHIPLKKVLVLKIFFETCQGEGEFCMVIILCKNNVHMF